MTRAKFVRTDPLTGRSHIAEGFGTTRMLSESGRALEAASSEFSALDELRLEDRLVLHNVLLAQVDDNHAGGVMGWEEEEHELAEVMFEQLERNPESTGLSPTQARAALLSLMYVVHEIDHAALSDDEWNTAESMLSHLAIEFGR